MEESQNIDFKGISLHMKKEMSRIRMLRIVFRILTSIVYLCTVVWFGFCILIGLDGSASPMVMRQQRISIAAIPINVSV